MLSTPADQRPDAARETLLALRKRGKRAGLPSAQLPRVPKKWAGCGMHLDGFLAFELFQRCSTQWTYVGGGMGGVIRTGIPHTEINAVAKTMRVPLVERRFVVTECEDFVRITLANDAEERRADSAKSKGG